MENLLGAYGSDIDSEMEGASCLGHAGAPVSAPARAPPPAPSCCCLTTLPAPARTAEEAGGQVTILGANDSEEAQGVDLSHLTSGAARAEPDTAATQPAALGPAPGPALGPSQQGEAPGAGEAPVAGPEPAGGEGPEAGGAGAAPASVLPPEWLAPPGGEPSPAVQAKVATWLAMQQQRGRYINTELRHSRSYRNPEFFRKMVEYLEIDEYGSNFRPEVGAENFRPQDGGGRGSLSGL